MALFGGNKESKEEQQARKEQMILERYGMQNLHNKEDVESVKRIAQELAGENFFDLGVAFGGANERELLSRQTGLQRAILEQNFVLIRQLDRIAQLLDK